ncbi:hypothetical protein [Rhodococcus jostii]|uniref:Uncharacterized protein n=1 Tax=Rhodococcus jostii TaxID=132919 RepID=A0A1H5HC50_RHOJO|nr:hypothetical protein [Rhodococcus jostii]SEE24848.1 hypothetical protein SAMN04490220_7131 [Rhodococcus jostii]
MKTNLYPSLVLNRGRESLISSSGALLLRESVRVAGIGPSPVSSVGTVAATAIDPQSGCPRSGTGTGSGVGTPSATGRYPGQSPEVAR